MYQKITNYSDIINFINYDYFYLVDRGDHIIINYMYSLPEVFPALHDDTNAAMYREFRGITFDKATGNLLRRPLPKFFNLSERSEATMLNICALGGTVDVYEKRDGSMIRIIGKPFSTDFQVLIFYGFDKIFYISRG